MSLFLESSKMHADLEYGCSALSRVTLRRYDSRANIWGRWSYPGLNAKHTLTNSILIPPLQGGQLSHLQLPDVEPESPRGRVTSPASLLWTGLHGKVLAWWSDHNIRIERWLQLTLDSVDHHREGWDRECWTERENNEPVTVFCDVLGTFPGPQDSSSFHACSLVEHTHYGLC